jgi:hypothetical protein
MSGFDIPYYESLHYHRIESGQGKFCEAVRTEAEEARGLPNDLHPPAWVK